MAKDKDREEEKGGKLKRKEYEKELRKLQAELRAKGVDTKIIEELLVNSSRTDQEELQKIIAKKRSRYDDEQKFMQYLARQGFSYDDIKRALDTDQDE